MQPPPQAGAGGPPPPATSRHMYWRNGPLGRRPNAPVSAAPGPVQPVRDPFAFGRQPPQGSPLGHATKGDPPLAPGFPPMAFPPPALPHAPQSHSGENSRSTDLCLPAPASQPGGSRAAPSAAAPPLSSPAHRTNSTEAHSGVEHGAHSPVGQTGCTGATLENSLWGPQGSASMPDRPVSGQEMNRNAGHACSTPTPLPVIPPGQQMVPQWMPAQSSSQPQAHAFSPYSEPLSQNAFYAQSTLGISQPAPHMTPQQSPAQPSVVQNATQAPLILGDASSAAASQQSPWRNVGGASPWPVQLPQEHFYLQPLEASHPSSNAAAQENSPLASNRSLSETAGGHCPADMDAGTISMFFKGDEAENEEILSSELTEQTGKADSDAFQQTMGHTYYQPLHAHQVPAAPFPPAQASLAEVLPKDAQQSFRTRAMQQDTQADPAFAHEDRAGLTEPGNRGGPQYENVENQECVQNQEVLPNEPLARSCPSPGAVDASRYASLLGPSLSKTGHVTPLEGGPNLEAPDASPRPTRPDSVSSSYSGLSHRSASGSAWPQELGTFIQQERGRPEAEPSLGFFQQIDSSPLGGGAADHNPGKSYHRSLSQAPTPSPPKPMGVFQTSANSSFEPVRSHGLGIRPPEADQAKVVAELRENCPGPRSTKKTPPSFVSPGNLEQPPDNLETCFLPQSHPLPLTIAGTAGNALQAVGGAVMENMPSAPEKRALARAQGVAKKCESPATTLWAHSELPNFGGNVLLAPAAPTVYVPAKPAAVHVVQPPEEGLPEPQTGQPGSAPAALPPAANVSSENLENPPKMGDEETGCSQASSGYASLLSSPPTEALQNQPVLIAQPPSCSLAQPLSFSLATQLSRSEKDPSVKDPGISSKPLLGVHGSGNPPGENTLSPSPLVHAPAAPALSNTNLPQGPPSASERTCGPPPNSLAEPASQGPLDLAPESKRGTGLEGLPPECASQPRAAPSGARGGAAVGVGSLGPVGGTSHRSKSNSDGQEPPRALDFAAAKPPEPGGLGSYTQGPSSSFTNQWGGPHLPGHMAPSAPGAPGPQHFYPQVTKDRQSPMPLDRATSLQHPAQTALPSQGMAPQLLPASSNPPALPGNSPTQAASQRLCPAGPSEANSAQLPASCAQAPAHDKQAAPGPPPASTALSAGQPARPPSQQEQAPPQPSQNAFVPPPNPYYYYRNPFDAYSSAYAPPYPPMDPRTAHLYYQDMYGQYDPSYQQYENAAAYPGSYRHVEPERPSSRASHTSDRPPSRQGYPEDYYNPKSGWNEYYTDYYAPSYADSSRYQTMYDAWYRDQRYWYDLEQNPYQKREPYALRNSHDHHDDYWHYDPRYVGGFEDELDSRRDPYGDDFDRRSIHSEHSGHSLHSSHSIHSRHSSFSSRSQQSQLYRSNHDPAASGYDTDPQPPSLHADYASGRYAQYASPPSLTGYNHAAWPAAEQVPSRPLTPEKFSVPHVCARFGPGGYLIKVLPNLPSEGQPALVEVHSMEMMMQHSSEQEEMRKFPGPLIKDETHKVDVINFAQSQATRCMQNEMLIDKESARLLWDFVVLLCRQNGTVVGTDIAELLLQEHKTAWLPGKPPVEANLIDFTSEAVEQAEESGEAQLSCLTGSLTAATDSLEKETERFRELLLYGRKKDALESAMKHGLWGHALLLASKMDSRTHARVMTRFANSLPINDPLQTVYQLMSGRMPAASTCCGDEKWGDWRPHLAMVLSNLTNNTDVESRTIITMGDTLVSKGLLDAAHFCYLMARVGFGVYTKKTAKLVLIGSNHSLPFLKFATNEAIQRTEAYEYAQSLGTQPCCLPSFQVFKFLYACRLAEMGLSAQAFHYCEVIARTILRNPHCYSPVLIGQVIQISSRLRLFDPQNKEKPEQELFIEPDWLLQLRILDGQIKEGALTYHTDRSTPQQHACCSPGSEVGRISPNEGTGPSQEMNSGPDNPLFASLLPPNMGHPVQSVQLMPSAPQAILDSSATTASSPHQESAGPVPFYPTAPTSVGPGTGFPNPYAAEHSPVYPGTMPPPAGLTPEAIQLQPQEQFNQEAAAQCSLPESPSWKSVPEPREDDFYGRMASMAQGFGQRSRTTSESSVHSVGRERRNSAAQQPSPPPPSIPEGKETKQETRKEPAPQKSGTRWLSWLMGKGRNEAHLPDDKNKSIVWDEKKQRWVNLDEPEEESKPPPPPPTGFPQVPQATPSGPGGPPNATINMFSRRAAGNRSRYVDILNPSGAKPPGAAPAPSDLFAPLAPMPVPANLFVPNPALEQQQPLEGAVPEEQVAPGKEPGPGAATDVPYLNSATFPPASELPPPNPEGSQSGELSRSSSMSSLSREVSQHFNQAPLGGPPTGAVQFYNPSHFAQPAAAPGSSRLSRMGQRKYPTLK
ncbi:protein transport protein Sec16A isoform X3 [Varanus komodoensis]|uniref:protein transport protein Sec16A isoform X3 n=1 Tax=Varanus komodoensis TaxID=61221 RepID=UPI001CF7D782|nr:protein transport protein Sec16A isoform X3 [Varanus komodoensis]